MAYPSSTDSFAGFTSSHTLSQDNHASQHNSEQSAIIAIENKVGTGASTPTNHTILKGNGTGTSAWAQVDVTVDASNGTTGSGSIVLSNSPVINSPTGTWIQTVYPIGCIYTETTGVNPTTTFGFGTWTAAGAGRVLIGNGTSDATYNAGATGGESNHTLTTAEIAAHTHTVQHATRYLSPDVNTGAPIPTGAANYSYEQPTTTSSSTGGGGSHNNLQPYLVVYFWKRTA